MLTAQQQQDAVLAITIALGRDCIENGRAEERARNIVQALSFADLDVQQRRFAIVAALELYRHSFRNFWQAVNAAHWAFSIAIVDSNGERFARLVAAGFTAEQASKMLQGFGFTLPEGVVAA